MRSNTSRLTSRSEEITRQLKKIDRLRTKKRLGPRVLTEYCAANWLMRPPSFVSKAARPAKFFGGIYVSCGQGTGKGFPKCPEDQQVSYSIGL